MSAHEFPDGRSEWLPSTNFIYLSRIFKENQKRLQARAYTTTSLKALEIFVVFGSINICP